MKIQTAGENSIIIYFFETIQESNISPIQQALYFLKRELRDYIVDFVPSYTSLWLSFDILSIDSKNFTEKVRETIKKSFSYKSNFDYYSTSKLIEIPVYYNEEVGLDLSLLAQEKGLNIKEIIEIHSSKTYTAFATGFTLGYAYLGILDERLVSPRFSTPRTKVPRNSLGIADNQTAIYPVDSPGGWKIIGKTSLSLVNLNNQQQPNVINVGDKVKFQPVDRTTFLNLGGEIL